MEILKKLAIIPALIAVFAFSGCKKTTYTFYTNMPQNGYQISDKSFVDGGLIGGYSVQQPEYTEKDTSGYTAKGKSYFAMTADAELVIAADFEDAEVTQRFNDLSSAVKTTLSNIEKAVSSSVRNSDIYNFNEADAGEILEVSSITYEILKTALDVYKMTEGFYNPALYYNIQAYGFGGAGVYPKNSSELPNDEIIAKYTDLASHFGELVVCEDGGKYTVIKPEYTVEVGGEVLSMKLDLGGIGKGYAVDRIDELFEEYGFDCGYFNFSSSSMLIKNHYIDGYFNLLISNPRSVSRTPYLEVSVRNEKLSTSGDDEQRYIIDGVRYCHIISPVTGKPVQTGIMSATVIGGSAAADDAITTAIMAMGKEKAIEFIQNKLTDRRVVFTLDSYVA